jgi:cytochrome b561
MALLLVGMVAFGLYMTDLPLGLRKVKLYAVHKSFGILILGLAVLRLLWRLRVRRPPEVAMPAWQSRAAAATALALYALMFLIPLSGWLFNSAAGFPLRWFGLVNLPHLVAASATLKPIARDLHETLAWTLIALVAVHAAAALKHHLIDRDRTLYAMLPVVRRPDAPELKP